jgi:uncharacterized protein (DUF1499 family)
MKALVIIAILVVGIPLALLAAGQLGLLRGSAPTERGLRDGKLKPPSRTANSASSQADLWPAADYDVAYAKIEPFHFTGDSSTAMNRLRDVLAAWPGARVVENRPDYIAAEFETRWLRFVDDAEFLLDPTAHVIHVRSKSRLGRKDFGVNRERVEALRRKLDLK